jgi:hypothetical protein
MVKRGEAEYRDERASGMGGGARERRESGSGRRPTRRRRRQSLSRQNWP